MLYWLRKTDEDAMICEDAVVCGDVALGRGVNIWFHAVLRGDMGSIVIGAETNIQDGVIIHEETSVGRGCTIGHGAILHGCEIGDNCMIGMGSIILNGAKIGDNCLIGAGSLVTGQMDAPDGCLILGSPAKVIRNLTEEEIAKNRESALEYLKTAEAYRGR